MAAIIYPPSAITIVTAGVRQPCGCSSWLEWDHGNDAWVAKSSRCGLHMERA